MIVFSGVRLVYKLVIGAQRANRHSLFLVWVKLSALPHCNNRCGNYSVCDERKEFDFGKCSCINGFDLVNQNQSAGCKGRVPLNCSQNVREDEFRELRGIKFPEFGSVIFLSNSEACKDVCVRDCSCNAYTFFRGVEHGGQSINIRIAESELGLQNV